MSAPITYPPIIENQVISCSRSGYPPMEATTGYTITSTKTRSGWDLPERFAHLEASGMMPATQYNASDIQRTLSPGKSAIRFGSPKSYTMTHVDTFYCTGGNVYSISDPRAGRVRTLAAAAANQKLRDQSMSLIETTWEGRKTLKMALDGARTLTTGLRQIRKGDFSGAAGTFGIARPSGVSTRRNISSNWLEYRYGWMPIIYEVNGALEHVRKNFSKDRILRVKGTASIDAPYTKRVSHTSGQTGNFDQAHIKFDVMHETTGQFKATVGYVYRITNPSVVQSQSLGLTNPLLTAWELLTLSFVADWFINVSDVLGQLDAWVGKEFLGGFSTVKYDEVTTRTSSLVSVGAGYSGAGFSPAKGIVTTRQIGRIPLTQQPPIGLVIRPQLNLKRLADGAALFRQFSR